MWRWLTHTTITAAITITTTIENFMMKLQLFTLVIAGALLTSITGCTVSGPSVKVRSPIKIESSGPIGHCPPGQAKKGRC